jgi:hypothetical protein
LRGVKLSDKEESSALSFDVNAKLEEKERKSGRLVVGFILTVSTKPSVVKFEVEGVAVLEGKNPAIERFLEADPKTKVPLLLHRVYQHVFTSTFLLATLLDMPYPPPDLLFSSERGKAGLEGPVKLEKGEEKVEGKPEEKGESAVKAKEAIKAQKMIPKPRRL